MGKGRRASSAGPEKELEAGLAAIATCGKVQQQLVLPKIRNQKSEIQNSVCFLASRWTDGREGREVGKGRRASSAGPEKKLEAGLAAIASCGRVLQQLLSPKNQKSEIRNPELCLFFSKSLDRRPGGEAGGRGRAARDQRKNV